MPSVLPRLAFFFLLFPFFVSIAQKNNGTVSVGRSLIAGNEKALWLSPSEDFAFGFYPLEDDNFLVAIWYYKIQKDNIVWYANENDPAPRESKLELTVDGLFLKNPQGDVLWRSNLTLGSSQVEFGVMNDTGNFKLIAENSQTRWESFKNLKDTLLPTQVLELNEVLSSRKRPNDFSPGRYQFRLRQDGNAVLNSINLPTKLAYDPYYESGTFDNENKSNSGRQVIFDESGYLYVKRQSGERFNIIAPENLVAFPASGYYHRITLNFNGVLTLSHYPKRSESANASWVEVTNEPENICRSSLKTGSGPCGYNSICRLTADRTPTCNCPTGYSLIDSTDEYSGCQPNFLLVCDSTTSSGEEGNNSHVQVLPLPNVNWPFGDYEQLQPYSVEDCKMSCLQDCLCAAAIYDSNFMSCWKKRIPFSNGIEDRGLSGTIAFIKVSNDYTRRNDPGLHKKEQSTNTLVVVVSSLLGSSVFVNFIFLGAVCWAFFLYSKKRHLKFSIVSQNGSSFESNLRHFTYEELADATNGFKKELGRGSCGIVYEGKLDQFGVVAVKILDRMFQDNDKQFQAEVKVIGQTHHKNLVRLIGYCNEKQHRLLIYEFMKNGTLAGFLFGALRPSWYQRIQIVWGLARGLVYLHEECSTQIIHCDIKPQNVLLDEYYNARISDFGLAKLLVLNQSHTKTNIRGTKGYVAPEWFRFTPISVKVDVYSFGVLLLEIICCRRNLLDLDNEDAEKVILVDWACDCYAEGRIEALVENDLEAMSDIKMVERFVMVAIWCLQEDPSLRPTMKKALLMLEGIVQVSAPPLPLLSSYPPDQMNPVADSPVKTSVQVF